MCDNSDKLIEKVENEVPLPENFENFYNHLELAHEVKCGFWIFSGPRLQKLASKKVYTLVYGLAGCLYAATFAYYNGTISTIEKRLKIPSTTSGLLATGNNLSQTFLTIILSYYVAKKHKPRWISFGLLTTVWFCVFNTLPYFIFGPGEDALRLTEEFIALKDLNSSFNDAIGESILCLPNRTEERNCNSIDSRNEESSVSQILIFLAQLISGVGGTLYAALGITYMDDNIKKEHAPFFISFSFFLRLLGPVFGYSAASFCLSYYISPSLHPLIDKEDPRWIGAYWMGWIPFGILILLMAGIVSLFPRHLPKAYGRKKYQEMQLRSQGLEINMRDNEISWTDMKNTFLRLITNKIFVINNLAGVFYVFSYLPFVVYGPKYIEIEYNISASSANLIIGWISLVFPALGVLVSGWVIAKFKPSGRQLAAWNVISSILSLIGILIYVHIGCPENDESKLAMVKHNQEINSFCTNSTTCHCDFIKYSPICGDDHKTYISPCHAGCTNEINFENKTILYSNCSCIHLQDTDWPGFANSGACPIDCLKYLIVFLFFSSLNKFIGGTEGTSNFLLGFRCIEERDKVVSIGVTMLITNILGTIPAPILHGYIFDSTCIVWGTTCTSSGNCWLYDSIKLRTIMNYTSSLFLVIAIILDTIVWRLATSVQIFDDV